MADTYTTRLLLTQPEVGENLNIWGGKLNSMFELVDKSVAGRTGYTLSGAKTLTRNNGAADEARSRFQDITGGTGGTVTIPSVESWYLVRNASSGNVVFTTGGDTNATISAGTVSFVVCNGADVWSPNLDGYVEEVQELIAQGIVDMNAILAEAEAQVGLAADQVGLAADQVTLAAAQVTLATTQANNASTFSTNASNSATAAAASAAAAAQSAKDAALFDPSSYYTKSETYSKAEVDTQINNLTTGAPSNLNSFAELAAAVGNDPTYSATVTAALALKANLTDRGLVLINSGTISSVAAVDITSGIDTTYDEYELHLFNIKGASAAALQLLLSSTGGSSWISSAYRTSGVQTDQSAQTLMSGANTNVPLANGVSISTSDGGLSGIARLVRPGESLKPQVRFETAFFGSSPSGVQRVVAAVEQDTAAIINAVRLVMASGNIASGKYKLYGVKK